jgi:hypothetical protein
MKITEVEGTMIDIGGSTQDPGVLMYVSLLPLLTYQPKFTFCSNRDAIEIVIGTETEIGRGMARVVETGP